MNVRVYLVYLLDQVNQYNEDISIERYQYIESILIVWGKIFWKGWNLRNSKNTLPHLGAITFVIQFFIRQNYCSCDSWYDGRFFIILARETFIFDSVRFLFFNDLKDLV